MKTLNFLSDQTTKAEWLKQEYAGKLWTPNRAFRVRQSGVGWEVNPGMNGGHLVLSERCVLHILPKRRKVSGGTRVGPRLLSTMIVDMMQVFTILHFGRTLESTPTGFNPSAPAHGALMNLLAQSLCDELEALGRTGLATRSVPVTGPCDTLEGELDLDAQFNEAPETILAQSWTPLYCTFSEDSADTEANRVLKAALVKLQEASMLTAETLERVASLQMRLFGGVTSWVYEADELEMMAYEQAPSYEAPVRPTPRRLARC